MADDPGQTLADDLKSLRIQREAPPRSLPTWTIWLVLLVALGGGGALAWSALSARLFLPEVQTTTVALVSPSQAQQLLVATGYVVPQRKANVAPRIGGRVSKILIEDGTEVKQGQILAVLEDADYRAQLMQAHADLRNTEAQVQRAQVEELDAQRAYDRELVVQQKGVSTPAALDVAGARLNSAKANVSAARAGVAAAQARVEVAKVSLDNCFVRAPFTGRITQKLADVGEIVFGAVGAGAGGNGGIASLADFTSLMVEADVSETQISKVLPGTPAEIALDAFPGKTWRGKVHEVRPRVDRAKATVTVKVAFVDPADGVLPDMGSKVTFLAKELGEAQAKAAPQKAVQPDAIVERGENKVLFVVGNDGAVQSVPVTIGEPLGNLVALKTGPEAGTKVVQKPGPELRAGMRVREKQ